MKKLLIILFALISFNCFSQYQYLGSGSSTTKLLLHLNGNSLDASGNSNNGTDSLVTYGLSYGKFNQGASFNGTASKIKFTDAASLKPTGNFTFSCWVNITSIAGTGTLVFQSLSQNPNRAGIRAYINTIGRFTFQSGKNTGIVSGVDYIDAGSSVDLRNKGWVNCICVYDGSYLNIYINGNLIASTAWAYNPAYAATNYVRIGCRNINGSDDWFSPMVLDETFLDGKAWTSSEIKRYYTFSKAWFFGLNDEQKHDLKYLDWFIPKQMAA